LQADHHDPLGCGPQVGLNRKQKTYRRNTKMAYKYIAEEWANPEKSFVEELMRQRLVDGAS
jgi:hypothetical protein